MLLARWLFDLERASHGGADEGGDSIAQGAAEDRRDDERAPAPGGGHGGGGGGATHIGLRRDDDLGEVEAQEFPRDQDRREVDREDDRREEKKDRSHLEDDADICRGADGGEKDLHHQGPEDLGGGEARDEARRQGCDRDDEAREDQDSDAALAYPALDDEADGADDAREREARGGLLRGQEAPTSCEGALKGRAILEAAGKTGPEAFPRR